MQCNWGFFPHPFHCWLPWQVVLVAIVGCVSHLGTGVLDIFALPLFNVPQNGLVWSIK